MLKSIYFKGVISAVEKSDVVLVVIDGDRGVIEQINTWLKCS